LAKKESKRTQWSVVTDALAADAFLMSIIYTYISTTPTILRLFIYLFYVFFSVNFTATTTAD